MQDLFARHEAGVRRATDFAREIFSDSNGRTTEDRSGPAGGGGLLRMSFRRDADGRILTRHEEVGGRTAHCHYTYDQGGRLAKVACDGRVVEEYAYGPRGERVADWIAGRGTGWRRFEYDRRGLLRRVGDVVQDYAEDGSLSAKQGTAGTLALAYENGGLRRALLPDGTVLDYKSGPGGVPVAKYVNGIPSEYWEWHDMLRLEAWCDAERGLEQRFHYRKGHRLPFAMTERIGDTTHWYELGYDQVGTLKAVADRSGNLIKAITFDSFGNVLHDTNPSMRIPFGFAGGVTDRHTGLTRFGHRDYDPDTGRFTAPDPARWTGGDPDLYEYCVDDPINKIDPQGLWPWSESEEDGQPASQAIWVWQSNEGACEKCKALDGTVVEDPNNPKRPHPNCKCKIIQCKQRVEYSKWVITRKGPAKYKVQPHFYDFAGPTGTAYWQREVEVTEQRTVTTLRLCRGSNKKQIQSDTETRRRVDRDNRTTKAYRFNTGRDVKQGDSWISTNPWTGQSVGKRY